MSMSVKPPPGAAAGGAAPPEAAGAAELTAPDACAACVEAALAAAELSWRIATAGAAMERAGAKKKRYLRLGILRN